MAQASRIPADAPRTQQEPVAIRNLEDLAQEIHERISRRAYELFESRGYGPGGDLEDWFGAEAELRLAIQPQIRETADSISVFAAVPGFAAGEVAVQVEPRRLVIAGLRQSGGAKESASGTTTERQFSVLLSTVDLPGEIDPTRARAALQRGTLGVALAKAGAVAASAGSQKRG